MKFPTFKVVLVGVAFLSVFFFPYPATLALSFFASVLFPLAGVAIGLLADLVYYTPAQFPLATACGALASVLGLLVHRFVKARIMTT